MNNKRIHRDYAYTLQGWLKDINGYRVDVNSTGVYDIGEDGSNTNYVNKRFGRDLFSSMIQYYQTDYSPISGNNYFNLVSTNSIDLYNGNISAISVGIKDLNPLLKSYRYDKINRIKVMTSAGLNNNVWEILSNLFGSTYSYDFNGNIESLIRYNENGNVLHNISYTYSADRNRLSSINVTGTGIGSSSYQYDVLGNLIRDNIENINITWNNSDKVKSVQTSDNQLNFSYNSFGQREIKRTIFDSTYYVYDIAGNVMSIYMKDYPKIIVKERPIYGVSRLGIMNKNVEFTFSGSFLSKSNSTIGIKEYELNDHLGNVCVSVLDRKYCNNFNIKPLLKSYIDYYPFGYPISFRTDNFQYRYGYNGQEGDNEIYGDNLDYAFTFRMYDTRIVRFWSVDPLRMDYPFYSSYQFAGNSPILAKELEGLEPWVCRPGIKYVNMCNLGDDKALEAYEKVTYNIAVGGVNNAILIAAFYVNPNLAFTLGTSGGLFNAYLSKKNGDDFKTTAKKSLSGFYSGAILSLSPTKITSIGNLLGITSVGMLSGIVSSSVEQNFDNFFNSGNYNPNYQISKMLEEGSAAAISNLFGTFVVKSVFYKIDELVQYQLLETETKEYVNNIRKTVRTQHKSYTNKQVSNEVKKIIKGNRALIIKQGEQLKKVSQEIIDKQTKQIEDEIKKQQ